MDRLGFSENEFEEMMNLVRKHRRVIPVKQILKMDISVNDKLCLIDDQIFDHIIYNNNNSKKWTKENPGRYKEKNKERGKRWVEENRERHNKNCRRWEIENSEKRKKQRFVITLNNKFWAQHQRGLACEKCGSTKKLQFAHHNPLTKKHNIAKLYGYKDRTKLKEELPHTTLLCEHCHDDYDHYFKRNYEEFQEFMKTPKLDR